MVPLVLELERELVVVPHLAALRAPDIDE
jgi:hypothetical protein